MTVIETSEHEDGLEDQENMDDDFLPRAKERPGPLTLSLIAVLIASLGFLGGILTQKHSGTSSATRSGANSAFNAANFTGLGANRRSGQGTTSGGAASPSASASQDSSSTATADVPAVIGTLVSVNGDTAIVKNLVGKHITVHLSGDTTVSKTATSADLQPGHTVTVSGTSETDGSVTATSVKTK